MPDCPKCKVTLAYGAVGGVCPACRKIYSPDQVQAMPGFDIFELMQVRDLYILLTSAGLLQQGVNEVEFTDDAMIIQHQVDSD